MEELKPCPFCGGEPFVSTRNSPYGHAQHTNGPEWKTIACKPCGFYFCEDEFKGPGRYLLLVEKWNHRFEKQGEK